VITIQYGGWTPDIANVGFQMPDQQGPVTVPMADCLNVYFQDGVYQSLPAPASIGPVLGYQCLNAFTWYDQVNGQEIVFAAGANAMSDLIDGAWSAVPISAGQQLLNATLTAGNSGTTIGYSLAAPYGTLNPTSDINNNPIGLISQSFPGGIPTFMVTINGTNLGANYFASIYFPSLNLSLPTSSATYSSSTSTTLLNATLTAGNALPSSVGYATAAVLGAAIGTLSPSVDSNGNSIAAIYSHGGHFFSFIIQTASLGATYFTNLQIPSLGVTLLASAATYSTASGQSTWTWNSVVPIVSGNAYNVLVVTSGAGPTSTWTWSAFTVPMVSGSSYPVILTAPSSVTQQASFWSFGAMGAQIAAIPYTQNAQATGPYLWSNQGGSNNNFARPLGAPGGRVGAIVGQFLMLGDLYQQQNQLLFTGNGSIASYSGFLSTPMAASGSVSDQQLVFSGTFNNGSIVPGGNLQFGNVDYFTGAINMTFASAIPNGDQVYANYTQVAPYRVMWSAIGNMTNWPTPLTNAALAVQSGINDLEQGLGQVMFISGYPLYAVIFQRQGLTRASYIGGNVVFSWQTYDRKRGLVAHGAAVQVGANTYFLSDNGFWYTDGANVVPIGTASDNSAGIDKWFWSNVNASALEAIRTGYDAQKRCVMWAIPTGSNTLPDTLLVYNILAGKWTRAAVSSESIWTTDNGTDGSPGVRQTLGVFDQTHRPNKLTGTPTATGYLESCDLSFSDGMLRDTNGVRPNGALTSPTVTVGTRNTLKAAVTYNAGFAPDAFSAGFAPALTEGLYTRIRVSDTNAASIQGATCDMTVAGEL
jgi:hypothetical protein